MKYVGIIHSFKFPSYTNFMKILVMKDVMILHNYYSFITLLYDYILLLLLIKKLLLLFYM